MVTWNPFQMEDLFTLDRPHVGALSLPLKSLCPALHEGGISCFYLFFIFCVCEGEQKSSKMKVEHSCANMSLMNSIIDTLKETVLWRGFFSVHFSSNVIFKNMCYTARRGFRRGADNRTVQSCVSLNTVTGSTQRHTSECQRAKWNLIFSEDWSR